MSPRDTSKNFIKDGTVPSHLRRRSGNKDAVGALQTILYELGFGNELNWQKYGADGDYGGGTTRAVRTFAQRNNQRGDGETVTPTIDRKLVARYPMTDAAKRAAVTKKYLDNGISSDERGSFQYDV